MHKLIKESLEKSFKLLNTNLVSGSDHSKLDIVVNTLVEVINGSPYNDEIKSLFKNNPDINNPDINTSVRNVVNFLSGKHNLITQCCENENKELTLAYLCDLTDEIVADLNCVTILENGTVIANQVDFIFFKNEVPNLGELHITEE